MKKMLNMQATMTPVVVRSFGVVPSVLEGGFEQLEIGERICIIKTKAVFRRFLETYGNMLLLTSVKACHQTSV